ncbi:peroxidase family protein [Endozoicomonas sp.]|uniref:peroxidase family protein n=1 Tax=Endozoicomonas sp. TaxID=1892382 RepID=UPI0028859828|nr:peroxidase family protein [Endozoicomonas sp.]
MLGDYSAVKLSSDSFPTQKNEIRDSSVPARDSTGWYSCLNTKLGKAKYWVVTHPVLSLVLCSSLIAGSITGAGLIIAYSLTSRAVDKVEPGEVRSFNGSGNNRLNPDWGAAGGALGRLSASDCLSLENNGIRPPPRNISNAIGNQLSDTCIPNTLNLTDMHTLWGQFINHDIDLTPVQSGPDAEKSPISISPDDGFFSPDDGFLQPTSSTGNTTIPFIRSEFIRSPDGSRQQVNAITSWIDGSMVYGSDKQFSDNLRTFSDGKMKASNKGLLPSQPENDLYISGDTRSNENIALTSMHTLFVREHNRLCANFADKEPSLSDEEIFQKARNHVIALTQVITYDEYLPTLLGDNVIDEYSGYNELIDPSVLNVFSTAAFRFAHSTVSDTLPRLDNDGNEVGPVIEMKDAIVAPELLSSYGDVGNILKGQSSQIMEEHDPKMVTSLRNSQRGAPGAGSSVIDLFSVDVQRGRDHCLPDYNTFRRHYNMEPYESFNDLTSDSELAEELTKLYGDIDNLDPWVGIISEDHLPNSAMGELGSAIIIDQFTRLRDGDRFWYTRTLNEGEIAEIEATTLSDVIKRNTNISNIQNEAFRG